MVTFNSPGEMIWKGFALLVIGILLLSIGVGFFGVILGIWWIIRGISWHFKLQNAKKIDLVVRNKLQGIITQVDHQKSIGNLHGAIDLLVGAARDPHLLTEKGKAMFMVQAADLAKQMVNNHWAEEFLNEAVRYYPTILTETS